MTARETGAVERGDTYEIGQQFFNLLHALLGAGGYGGNARDCKLTITLPTKADASKLVERLQADARAAPLRSAIRAGNSSGYWQGFEYEIAARPRPTPSATGEIVERLNALLHMTVPVPAGCVGEEGSPMSPEFRVSVQLVTDEGVHIIIHADGHSSDTLDIVVTDKGLALLAPLKPGETQVERIARTAALIEQQAATIAERDARIEALETALRPFADFAEPSAPAEIHITQGSYLAKRQLLMGDCHTARATLERTRGQ